MSKSGKGRHGRTPRKLHFRTVFLSDTHLGTYGARAADLARFLRKVKCDKLYLVGDIIDMWRLRKRWFWPAEHNEVVRRVLRLARKGTQVIYVPGNHDAGARQYHGLQFGGVQIRLHDTHTTAAGRNLLITHGDQYDMVVKHHPLLSAFGGWLYDWLVRLNVATNAVRDRVGLGHWSLSLYLKLKVKSACTFISRYEQTLTHEARRRGADGVVCGHIHKAELRLAAEQPEGKRELEVDYFNCGDWVEGCTALVEHADGRMELIDGIAAVEDLHRRKHAERAARREAKAQRARERVAAGFDATQAAESADDSGAFDAALPVDRFAESEDGELTRVG